jgi:hypothetical protein
MKKVVKKGRREVKFARETSERLMRPKRKEIGRERGEGEENTRRGRRRVRTEKSKFKIPE